MPALSPAERKLRGEIAAHERWAKCPDRTAATEPARSAFLKRFEEEVDPDRKLDPAERARRADHARTAHMKRLALKSARARSRSTGGEAA